METDKGIKLGEEEEGRGRKRADEGKGKVGGVGGYRAKLEKGVKGRYRGRRIRVGASPLLLPILSPILSHVPTAVHQRLTVKFISFFLFHLLPPQASSKRPSVRPF